MKKIKILLLTFLFTSTAHAGFKELTHHSRANCLGINESISWQFGVPHRLVVYGTHYKLINGVYMKWHESHTKNSNTWRAAVLCLSEVTSGTYKVHGDHYLLSGDKIKNIWTTEATDCSIYDGWWDSDHAERKS